MVSPPVTPDVATARIQVDTRDSTQDSALPDTRRWRWARSLWVSWGPLFFTSEVQCRQDTTWDFTWIWPDNLPAETCWEDRQKTSLCMCLRRWYQRHILQASRVKVSLSRHVEHCWWETSSLQPNLQDNTQENTEGVLVAAGRSPDDSKFDSWSLIGWNLAYFLSRSERDVSIILQPILARCLYRIKAHFWSDIL